MRRFVRTKELPVKPQTSAIFHEGAHYFPVFLHATIDQDHPVGHKRTFVEHEHDFYHIVLYTKGYGEFSMEGVFHPAQPGACVLTHPGQRHDFVSRWERAVYSEITFSYETSAGDHLNLSFEELLEIYTGSDLRLNSNLILPIDQMHVLRNLLSTSTDHLNSVHPLSSYHAQHGLAKIFSFLIKNAVVTQPTSFTDNRFERVKNYIEEHFFEQLSADELANLAGVSRGYFFREFKKLFAISPMAHQQAMRVEAAKTLLRTTLLRCNEIAWRVGFSDVYFFHRIFKKHTGITPNQFRKR